jgi:hypothetical protein
VTIERARNKQHKPDLIAGIALDTKVGMKNQQQEK